jgi:ribosome-associated translation inhibitor RaiA
MLPARVAAHNVKLGPAEMNDILERVLQLERFYPRVENCTVMVDAPQRRRRSDRRLYAVRIVLTVPRGRITVARQPRGTLASALDAAFQAVRRRLQDRARRLRGATKVHATAP